MRRPHLVMCILLLTLSRIAVRKVKNNKQKTYTHTLRHTDDNDVAPTAQPKQQKCFPTRCNRCNPSTLLRSFLVRLERVCHTCSRTDVCALQWWPEDQNGDVPCEKSRFIGIRVIGNVYGAFRIRCHIWSHAGVLRLCSACSCMHWTTLAYSWVFHRVLGQPKEGGKSCRNQQTVKMTKQEGSCTWSCNYQ